MIYVKLISFQILFYILHSTESGTETILQNQVDQNITKSSDLTVSGETEINKLPIKVYYETLCPASVEFFTDELGPALNLLASYIDVHMIPYGFATTTPTQTSFTFTCQHDREECLGNRIHACAINKIQNNSQAALFNVCLMKHTVDREDVGMDFVTALSECGNQLNVSMPDMWKCAVTSEGALLLKNYGDETKRFRPSHVPYVLYGKDNQIYSYNDETLTTVICDSLKQKPKACQNSLLFDI